MKTERNEARTSRTGRPWRLGAGVLALTLALGACDTDGLVQLDNPDLITLPVVLDTANRATVRNGAVFEFNRAMAGPAGNNQTPGLVGTTAWMTDEAWYASTFSDPLDIDRRFILETNGAVGTVYAWLHRARNLSEEAAEIYANAGDGQTGDYAMLKNMAGYTYVFFAENFCSGVPFSTAPLGEQIEFASGSTTAEMYTGAMARFDDAIAAATAAGDADQLAAARLGKARVHLNRNELTQAAALAAQVPTGFVFEASFSESSAGQNNGVWYNINSERRTSVATNEGVNGIDFFDRGATANTTDPRVPVDSSGFGIGTAIPHYAQAKYATRGSNIAVGSGIEARLIEAEASLNGGATPGGTAAGNWLRILNDLRATEALPALTDPGNADDRVLMLFEERARWLWLTAHRLGDLRRLIRQYGFTQAEVFPVGTTEWGGEYGTDVNFLIPDEERNNPDYAGSCFDRNA